MGDNGVTEGWAMTFDHLMMLPTFLRRVAGISDPGPYLRFAAFRELAALRRYCAKFAYERSLHREGPGPGADPSTSSGYLQRRARAPEQLGSRTWILTTTASATSARGCSPRPSTPSSENSSTKTGS